MDRMNAMIGPGSHDIGDESWKDAAMRAPGSIAMICVGDLQ